MTLMRHKPCGGLVEVPEGTRRWTCPHCKRLVTPSYLDTAAKSVLMIWLFGLAVVCFLGVVYAFLPH